MPLYSNIIEIIEEIETLPSSMLHANSIDEISFLIRRDQLASKQINLNFICTHNSRRSQFSQVWAYVFAHYFKLDRVRTYSSGTESTQVYPTVIKTLSRQGFKIQQLDKSKNPKYLVRISDSIEPLTIYSKTIDEVNQSFDNFSAIMTCSSADQACPIVSGASSRHKLTFEDPKFSDNTKKELKTYQTKSIEIANTLFYIFKQADLSTT